MGFDARADEGMKPAPTLETPASRKAGTISRFEREIVVIEDKHNPHASPASQYFDDVMDHLEMLMADKIKENNEIAALQRKIPGYRF